MGRNPDSSRKRRPKKKHDINSLDADDANKKVKQRDQGGNNKQYRSNLTSTVTFFSDVYLRPEHFEILQQTPFYHMVLPFAKHKITAQSVTGTQQGALKLMSTYNKQGKYFEIGGKHITIAPSDCECIFGIKSGRRKIISDKMRKPTTGLAARKFAGHKKLKLGRIKHQLVESLQGNEEEDIRDVVRLIVLHLMANFFFITSGEFASWWMFRYCDNIEAMRDYNWSKGITDFFLNSVQNSDPEKVQGCVPLLLYCICERSRLLQPEGLNSFPRFRKWHTIQLGALLKTKAIEDIPPSEVNEHPLILDEREYRILEGLEQPFEENDSDDYDGEYPYTTVQLEHDATCDENTMADDIPISILIKNKPKTNLEAIENKIETGEKEVNLQYELAEATNRLLNEKQRNMDLQAAIGRLVTASSSNDDLRLQITMLQNANLELQDEKVSLEAQVKCLRNVEAMFTNDAPTFDLLTQTQPDKQILENALEQISRMRVEITELKSLNEALQQQNFQTENRMELSVNQLKPSVDHSPIEPFVNHTPLTQSIDYIRLTVEPPHVLEIMELRAEIQVLKSKEKSYLKQIQENDIKIFELESNCEQLTKALDKAKFDRLSDSDFEIFPNAIQAKKREATSAIGRRTRSKKPNVTPQSLKKTRRVVKFKKWKAYTDMDENDRIKVDILADELLTGNRVIWKNPDGMEYVLIEDVFSLLGGLEIASSVIDAYCHILTRQQTMGCFNPMYETELAGTSYVFPSMLLSTLRQSSDQTFVPPKDINKHRYLVFPLHSKGNKNTSSDHWTLLILDKQLKEWKFYNSLRSRINRKDVYVDDASDMKQFIENTMKAYNLTGIPIDKPIIEVENAPQQKPDSKDCGIFVLYIIRDTFIQTELINEEVVEGVTDLRRLITETFLNFKIK